MRNLGCGALNVHPGHVEAVVPDNWTREQADRAAALMVKVLAVAGYKTTPSDSTNPSFPGDKVPYYVFDRARALVFDLMDIPYTVYGDVSTVAPPSVRTSAWHGMGKCPPRRRAPVPSTAPLRLLQPRRERRSERMRLSDDAATRDPLKPYAISKGPRGSLWHRWQSESEACRFARRGRTPRAARRRMARDARIAIAKGRRSFGQWWRIERAERGLPDRLPWWQS